MAKIGLRYPAYKTPTKTGVIGKAVTANITVNSNDAKLYGDDTVAESDTSWRDGTIALTTTDLPSTALADLLGHTTDVGGETVYNIDDVAQDVMFGFYGVSKVNGVQKYRAVILTRVKFKEPNDNNATKGENVAFQTHDLEGLIMADAEGNWKKEQTFETATLAKEYIDTELGIGA